MFGTNIFKGLWITFYHWAYTYWQDIQGLIGRPWKPTGLLSSGGVEGSSEGYFTVQYPEQKITTPERFRFMPMLIYEQEDGDIRCTACGICAKVCPPQCIWIVQSKDAERANHPAMLRVLHRHLDLHAVWLLRRVLPLRRYQDEP